MPTHRSIDQIPLGSSCLNTTRLDTFDCRVHAFWLRQACRTARLAMLVSTRSTRRTCRDVTLRATWNLGLSEFLSRKSATHLIVVTFFRRRGVETKVRRGENAQTQIPGELGEVAHADDGQQKQQVESLAHVAARHLEKVVLLELLEHASLQLHELPAARTHTHRKLSRKILGSRPSTLEFQIIFFGGHSTNATLYCIFISKQKNGQKLRQWTKKSSTASGRPLALHVP